MNDMDKLKEAVKNKPDLKIIKLMLESSIKLSLLIHSAYSIKKEMGIKLLSNAISSIILNTCTKDDYVNFDNVRQFNKLLFEDITDNINNSENVIIKGK